MSLFSTRQPAATALRMAKFGRSALVVCAIALAVSVGACGGSGFQPMYASLPGGGGLADRLSKVQVTHVPGRAGQLIRNELLFQTGGSTQRPSPTHRLDIAIRETVSSTLVNREGDSASRVYYVDATFQLFDLKTNRVILSGASAGRAGYERFTSLYADVRAQNDAQRRSALTVARDIQARVAAHLAGS